MKDTEKYLIHATIAADGVVERSDVVGAVFGQTEGLLGDELDLRDLQESSRVGRIDVSVESENGQSFGEVTVASSLDKVETAILAAALETIDRIGPCHASVEVTSIEDVRAAKRREVVERAKELIAGGFEETSLASSDVLDEVRDAARVEGIVDYEGLPAGPRVGDSDAVIVVEGRADVLTLLDCGIKNAVAVEGTNVPDAVADLTADRTVTAFLDGDRGGELILRELSQVGDVDYVAFAPPGESVEDLGRDAVFEALRGKVPYASLADAADLRAAASDEGATESDPGNGGVVNGGERTNSDERADGDASGFVARVGDGGAVRSDTSGDGSTEPADADAAAEIRDPTPTGGADDSPTATTDDGESQASVGPGADGDDAPDADSGGNGDADPADETDEADTDPVDESVDTDADPADESVDTDEPDSIAAHVGEVVDDETGRARLLDEGFDVLDEVDAGDAFDAVEGAETAPHAVVVDGTVDQRLLDVSAQRGVGDLVGRDLGEFVKRPVGTRVLTAADLRAGS
ncbi:DNA primase [Halorubrum sp. GN11_10-6_MGM]|uniref:DNA primase DnaG n=1 Tax=Halorubrum sp. GN11_10-6_MGM TaxID=2518112 RepID=UPI0010F6F040|nr:DNA primase DnaG [Halorubrum sp. GN11_10-6_MGM]TKX75754.1 DNA primase [Halorubrum sp. GN11_10-6_MGM]